MRRHTAITLATSVGLVAILCIVALSTQWLGLVGRWAQFYTWRFFSGKAHGGQYLRIDDYNIYFETFGAGPPVLVLHGGLGSMVGMGHQIMALARSHLVIAVDSRGHGQSSDGNAPLSYSLMSDDTIKVLDHLKIDRVDVVGWSDGGIIGLDLAIRHPERVRKLVAISANYDADGLIGGISTTGKIPHTSLSYRFLAPNPAHWPIFYRKVVTMWQTQPHYTLNDLNQITAPTLVIAGENDVVKREHTHQLARAIPHSHELIIDGATHMVPVEKPKILDSSILSFLDEPTN